MGAGALVFTIVGAACTVLGIITALAEKIQVLEEFSGYVGFSWTFWFMLAVISFLITIASSLGGSSKYD